MRPHDERTVHFLAAGDDLRAACRRMLAAVYGDEKPWRAVREVLLKPNAVNFEPHVFVDPALVGALVSVLREDGAERVTVMESCTNGSFTRLVFAITGMREAVEETGGRCVYLDEGRSERVDLGESGAVEVPAFAAERLLRGRDQVFYVDLAKLKTHSMTTVTLCLKNQWCFVDPRFRDPLHDRALHRSIAEVNRLFVPDLCVVEGLVATNHGHFPLAGHESKTLWRAGLLAAGRDAVAVDAACCRLIGIDPASVEHLSLSARDPACLEPEVIHHDPIDVPAEPFSDVLLPVLPEGLTLHVGKEKCCREGCYSNPVCAVQVLAANYGGGGNFDLFMGKGHDSAAVDGCDGPALVVGPCAHKEVYPRLVDRLGKRKVRLSPGHNDLRATIKALISLMGVGVFRASPLPPHRLLALLVAHKWAGSRAVIGFF
jgi:uncharacterized protein (DUF362 family)